MIVSEELKQYLNELIPERDPIVMEMEKVAKEENVPIMELISLEVMLQILSFIKPKRILEIGTAIGYSAIRMARALPDCEIVTMEIDEKRYEQAVSFIKKTGHEHQIKVIFGDALLLEEKISANQPFDCLFIDAAKGQYQKFFALYSKYLTKNGVIISDNILFRGYVAKETMEIKRLKGMVSKIKDYNKWLMEHPEFQTTIYPVGDGVAVSRKR